MIYRIWAWESDFNLTDHTTRMMDFETRQGMFWVKAHAKGSPQPQKVLNDCVRNSYRWLVICRAMCMNEAGAWIDSNEMLFTDPVRFKEIEDMYKESRKSLKEKIQHRHIYDLGWIAQVVPKGQIPIQSEILQTLHVGDWSDERKTLWEYAQTIIQEEIA